MRSFILIVIALAVCAPARADTPLPPPRRHIVKSADGTVRAVSDPRTGTQIEAVPGGRILWHLPGWYRSLFVANDGKHLVTGYNGLNLIPREPSDSLVLITFWREGRKIKEVTLSEIVPDRRILKRTASHYFWGHIEGIDGQGPLRVKRADDTIFYFDITSGEKTA
jgi:hypothetical protein